ncbi:MAG TPA: YdiU family protein [Gammaproteobacteria bacterium]|nr:YdiU family protein [Gammaproteobacteria bacterium]
MSAAAGSLAALRFDNVFVRELPADPATSNARRQVLGACYSRVLPTPVRAPALLACSPECAALLDLDERACRDPAFTDVFAGNRLLPGMDPHAMCYGGHQFGHWAGQLGDGRAINLGEVLNRAGERWTLQLKGAGPTPYSRTADGLAVLRSSVREFLCSEAMHHLGVPTTRALSLIATGEQVMRDMFYDGRARFEPGAVVCRVAPSFLRFGNFEILAARRDLELLRRLVDYSMKFDYPQLGEPSKDGYVAWLTEIATRTATMIAHWLRVGFVHGVMNTDNMSVLGLTIDYGPYGWLEGFDPDWTPNTTDAQGRRYRYGQQAQIALWNLVQLANAIHPLVEDVPALEGALDAYGRHYTREWTAVLAAKLGLEALRDDADRQLAEDFFGVLRLAETDMTIAFRELAGVPCATADDTTRLAPLIAASYSPEGPDERQRTAWLAWCARWQSRLREEAAPDAARAARMNRVNPKYVLRNWLAQEAIDLAEQGDASRILEQLEVLRRPYDEQPGREHFAARRPEWARQRAGCSMLSCSS